MPKRRVLIVEDEVAVALDLEAIVASAVDAEVLLSRSVARAKALLDYQSVDLALLDVDVTNGKTFDVAALLRLKQVPFVFLSASRRDQIPDEFREAPFIAKPFEERDVVEHIREFFTDRPRDE